MVENFTVTYCAFTINRPSFIMGLWLFIVRWSASRRMVYEIRRSSEAGSSSSISSLVFVQIPVYRHLKCQISDQVSWFTTLCLEINQWGKDWSIDINGRLVEIDFIQTWWFRKRKIGCTVSWQRGVRTMDDWISYLERFDMYLITCCSDQ